MRGGNRRDWVPQFNKAHLQKAYTNITLHGELNAFLLRLGTRVSIIVR